MTRSLLAARVASAAILILASSPASAQGRWDSGNRSGHRLQRPQTPYGLCRVSIRGVPPERQPAVTGCAYAYSNLPRNGRVIYGGERGELFARRSGPYYYDRRSSHRDYRDRDYRDRDYRDRDYRDRDYRDRDYRDRDDDDRDHYERSYRDSERRRDRSDDSDDYSSNYSYSYSPARGHGHWK